MLIEKEYFVYAHIRPDTGDVFYIGRGKKYSRCSPTYRAYDTRRRNVVWERVVAKNGGKFTVKILEWFSSKSGVLDGERKYILKYGRRTDGDRVGTLINLTDGGDGSLGLKHSRETRRKLSRYWKNNKSRIDFLRSDKFKKMRMKKVKNIPPPMLGKKLSKETRSLMSKQRSGSKNVNAKRVVDRKTGIIYGCVEDAANAINISKWTLYKSLSGERKNNTTLRYI